MTLEQIGKDYNESVYVPIRQEADRQDSDEAWLDNWSAGLRNPQPPAPVKGPEPSMLQKLFGTIRFDPMYPVKSFFKPFEVLSNTALAPIAKGSENATEAFKAAGSAAWETIQSTPDRPATWQAQKVVEQKFPELEGWRKATATIVLDTAADPTTWFGVGLATQGPKMAKVAKELGTDQAAQRFAAEFGAERFVELLTKADAGDAKARVKLMEEMAQPEKFESLKATLLAKFGQETRALTTYKGFPVSADSAGWETLVKSSRAEGAPNVLVKELMGEYLETPHRFRSRYLNINSPDDAINYATKRADEARVYVTESIKKATPEEEKQIINLLSQQPIILQHNISDKVAKNIDGISAFAYNELFNDIGVNMQRMMAKTPYMFDSPHDRLRWFKLLGLREQLRAELTLTTKPASKLISLLNTRSIDGSQAIQNVMVNRAIRALPKIDPQVARTEVMTPVKAMEMASEEFSRLRGLIRNTKNPGHLNQFLNGWLDDTFGDKLHRAWLHGLFSRTSTHIRNMTVNATLAVERPFFDVAAAIADPKNAPEHLMTGLQRLVGLGEASWDSLQAIALLGREAKLPASKGEWIGMHEIAARVPQLSREAIAELGNNRALEWISHHLPGQMLAKEDSWFKAINAQGQRRASAWGRAWRISNNPIERRAIFDRLMRDPTEAMQMEMLETAERMTFQQELGRIGTKVAKGIDSAPGTRWLVPLKKTPGNIIAEAYRHMPGLNVTSRKIWSDIRSGGARREAAIGQLLFTNAVFTGYMLAATDGRVTGGAMSQEESARLGIPRYAVKFDGTWISYERNDVLRWTLGIPITLKEIAQEIDWQAEDRYEEATKAFSAVIAAYGTTLTDNFWIFNLANTVDGIGDLLQGRGTGGALFALERLMGSISPGAFQQMLQVWSPHIRHTENMLERMKSTFGIGKFRLPIDVDLLGNKRKHNLTSTWLGINISDATDDPVISNLRKLNANLPDVAKVIRGKELGGDERMLMRSWVAAGPAGMPPLRDAIAAKMAAEDYQRLSLADKREAVERLIRFYNEAALGMLIEGR